MTKLSAIAAFLVAALAPAPKPLRRREDITIEVPTDYIDYNPRRDLTTITCHRCRSTQGKHKHWCGK